MADEPIKEIDKTEPEEKIIFQISLSKDGSKTIHGPILADKILALGILEDAKDMVRELYRPQLVRPTGGIMNFIRKNGKH